MDLYVLFLAFLIPLFFLNFVLRLSASTTNLPPGPIGLPIIGSLHQLRHRPHESLSRLSRIHGPIMTLHLGCVTTIIISSAEAAKEIFQNHDHSFSERTVPVAVATQSNPEATLAWVTGDHRWRNRRRICTTHMFTVHRLNSLEHLRQQKVEQLIDHIKKRSLSGEEVDIGKVVFATTLNLISSTIFSMDVVDAEYERAQDFKDLVWRIMEDAGKPNLSDYFPVLSRLDIQGLKRHITIAYTKLHEIFDEIIGKRLESGEKCGDFLDVLLDQCQTQGSDLNRQTIKPLILDLFIAGSDTSAITTEWAMAELLKQPNLLQKAKKEIIQVIGTEGTIKENDFDRLPYLQAVVKETLRLHPAVPLLLPYKASNSIELLGYTIPKGTQLLVNAWSISRDSKYCNDPLKFCPERFLSSDVDFKGHHFEYIPFGAGRRICPGLPLAVRMVQLLLASLIRSFDWKLPTGIDTQNLNMEEQFGVTLKKAVPLRAIPILDRVKT